MFRSTTRTCPVLSREEFVFDLRGQIVLLPGRTWRYVFFLAPTVVGAVDLADGHFDTIPCYSFIFLRHINKP